MPKGVRHGGRQKGTPNKKTQELSDMLKRLNCDPIKGMALIATGQVECPECWGKKKQKYSIGIAGLYVDIDGGKEMTCCKCYGKGLEPIPVKLRADMYAELAQYLFPKRKAVEVTGESGEPLSVTIALSGITAAAVES